MIIECLNLPFFVVSLPWPESEGRQMMQLNTKRPSITWSGGDKHTESAKICCSTELVLGAPWPT